MLMESSFRKSILLVLPLALVFGAGCKIGWAKRAEEAGVEALRKDTIADLGAFRELRESGYHFTSVFVDTDRARERLVLLRTGTFELGEWPVVISAMTPESRKISGPSLVPGEETDLRFTKFGMSEDGQRLRKGKVVSIVLAP